MADLRRVDKEIRQCIQDKASNIKVHIVGENLTHLKGVFKGPEGTPYEGGTFVIDIHIPSNYPFQPPKMKFDTRVYHPNISSQTGAICLDILKDNWSPVLTLKTALISLQSLLCDAAPNDPQDAEVAGHYLRDRAGFNKTAKQWTELHAMKPTEYTTPTEVDDAVGVDKAVLGKLLDMGFERKKIIETLRKVANKEDRAIEILLGA